jgi:predicted AlkP superfamily phosphohydrolase/phosphomutase
MQKPKKVAVLGFDCALPHLIERHISEGHLPNFKKLIENGVMAENCLPPFPTITPPNWATIATGAWPGTHQVTDFHLPKPGLPHMNANIFEAFSSEHCKAETIWDRLDSIGMQCIVVNYPGAWPSRMKNGIMIAGEGLSPDEHRNGLPGMDFRMTLGADQLVTTGPYPWGTKVEFRDADDWKNLPQGCEEPLAAEFDLAFRLALAEPENLSWHVLITQSSGNGYDRVTLAPTKDYKDAFFTVLPGQWGKKTFVTLKMKNGEEKKVFFRCKLLELSDDATDFRLLISPFGPTTGWSDPPEIAEEIRSDDGLFVFAGGMFGYVVGWYELDTYAEMTMMHDIWLGDAICHLLTKKPWQLFYMHSHPPDWIYHAILTHMDEKTCASRELYEKAWEMHLKVYQSQDRMLGRIMEAAGEDTLFITVSDHGAVMDGVMFNPYHALVLRGLAVMEETAPATTGSELTQATGIREDRLSAKTRGNLAMAQAVRPDLGKSRALAERTIHIYVNLKGREPGGIVEPEDYEKVQREIIEALYNYVDPTSGVRPVALALSKRDARLLGLYGDAVGDVIYAVYPEFGGQHGQHLATAEWGVGKLKSLLTVTGPGIKVGWRLERTCWLTDIVPTVCYLMNWPVPADAEGSVIYQVFEDPNFRFDDEKAHNAPAKTSKTAVRSARSGRSRKAG